MSSISKPKSNGLRRVRDPDEILSLCLANAAHDQSIGGIDEVKEWVSEERNVALRLGDDLGLFEHFETGIFETHCFCRSRGKDALTSIRQALEAMIRDYGATSFFGHVQRWNERWLYRRLGFESVREVERNGERYIFMTLTQGNLSPESPML